jgi:hypothetical protein
MGRSFIRLSPRISIVCLSRQLALGLRNAPQRFGCTGVWCGPSSQHAPKFTRPAETQASGFCHCDSDSYGGISLQRSRSTASSASGELWLLRRFRDAESSCSGGLGANCVAQHGARERLVRIWPSSRGIAASGPRNAIYADGERCSGFGCGPHGCAQAVLTSFAETDSWTHAARGR